MMIEMRHIRHPVRSARSLVRKLRRHAGEVYLSAYRKVAERQFADMKRGHRDKCWCGGELAPLSSHAGYGVCQECGSFVNRFPPLPSELNRLYSLDLYWRTRQKMKGYPAIEGRVETDLRGGRVGYWQDLVERYAPPGGTAIEVGCAHGIMLAALRDRGWETVGVEVDEETARWTREHMHLDVRAGIFPDVDLPACDLFLAFDVIEHSHNPQAFMERVAELLRPGGVAVIQTPIERYGYEPPFGEKFQAAFDDVEHLFLFTNRAMEELAHRTGLEIVANDERMKLHHEICVFCKPSGT